MDEEVKFPLLPQIVRQKMIYIGSAMTASYRPRAEPYFRSIRRALQPDVCRFLFVGIDFDPASMLVEYELENHVESFELSSHDLHDPSNVIIQHGDFLSIDKKWNDEDYILWVDCDAFFQRPLCSYDLAHFAEGKACAGKLPNKGEEQLKFEFARLGGDGSATAAIEELGFDSRLAEAPTLNTGCVGASVRHWRVLRDQYNRNAQAVKKYTSHYARQQFLMSLIIHSRFELEIMPKYIHCDGHYALPEFIHEESETFVCLFDVSSG